jgi:hypothetical protein
VPDAILGDCIDYDELHTGIRSESGYTVIETNLEQFMEIPAYALPMTIVGAPRGAHLRHPWPPPPLVALNHFRARCRRVPEQRRLRLRLRLRRGRLHLRPLDAAAERLRHQLHDGHGLAGELN